MYTGILSDPDRVKRMQERFPEGPFCKWLEAQGGYVWHGKYKYTTAKFVWENDPQYARWVKELPQPSKGMIAIKRYRKRRRSLSPAKPVCTVPKRRRSLSPGWYTICSHCGGRSKTPSENLSEWQKMCHPK